MQRVFVSYSHDNFEHGSAVHSMCEALKRDGFDVVFDGYVAPPDDGWFEWSEKEIDVAETVLVVCTDVYRKRFEGEEEPGKGHGASWEARKLRRLLVKERGYADKIVPVLLHGHSIGCIPEVLSEHHRIEYGGAGGHDDLVAAILGLPRNVPDSDFDWQAALAGLTLKVVGPSKFASWVRWRLDPPEVDDGEKFFAYAKRVIRHAHEAGKIEYLFQCLLAEDGPPGEDLERIRAQWRVTEPSVEASVTRGVAVSSGSQPANGRELEPTHTAIVLDRTTAWTTITSRSAYAAGHLVFIVYGNSHQDLHLFLRRIQLYFTHRDHCPRIHRVLNVESLRDHTQAVTAEDWERATIQATRSRQGPLSAALEDEAWDEPVLLLLSTPQGPFRGLSAAQYSGLAEFVSQRIPAALTNVSRENPVRVLVPFEVEDPRNPSMVQDLQRAIVAHGTTMELEEPIRLESPSWPEIEYFIAKHYPRLDHAAIDRCRARYERIVAAAGTGFHLGDLADQLHALFVTEDRAARAAQDRS